MCAEQTQKHTCYTLKPVKPHSCEPTRRMSWHAPHAAMQHMNTTEGDKRIGAELQAVQVGCTHSLAKAATDVTTDLTNPADAVVVTNVGCKIKGALLRAGPRPCACDRVPTRLHARLECRLLQGRHSLGWLHEIAHRWRRRGKVLVNVGISIGGGFGVSCRVDVHCRAQAAPYQCHDLLHTELVHCATWGRGMKPDKSVIKAQAVKQGLLTRERADKSTCTASACVLKGA